jgi:hypothetical protein
LVGKIPYEEIILDEKESIRKFSKNSEDEELKWHFDEEDRTVEILENSNWLFQFDDELPFSMDSAIFIPKGRWHRIIKGEDDLIVKIKKH